jgi:hypothetical protein
MSKITIPPAALEAGARTLCNEQRLFWHGLTTEAQDIIRGEARAAMVAAFNAWPGMKHYDEMRVFGEPHSLARLILPLTQETSDE